MANRYFLDPLPSPGRTVVRGDLAHHLAVVLRTPAGTSLVLADGKGKAAAAVLVAARKQEVTLEVGTATQAAARSATLLLAFATPKSHRAEWLIEHGTELGVAAFAPLWTERSRPQPDRSERWRRIALAAAGQCAADWLPRIAPPRELAAFLADPELPAMRWFGDLSGSAMQPAAPGHSAVVLVGPEGGFSPAEVQAITAAGFQPRRFAAHILRTETAALVGAAVWLAGTV